MGYSDAYPGGYGAGGDLITTLLIETDPDDWYDATDQLISGNIIRGRSSELDEFQAGTCEVVLDNDDRTFDPTYAASPLNGHILPMKRIRLLATWSGVQYPLFAGYADRWTQNSEGPHRGTTTLAATDGFKVLARARLASSAYAHEVAVDEPAAWWRLDEMGGTIAHDSIGGVDLAAHGTPALGAETLIARDSGAAAEFDDLVDGEDGFVGEVALVPITGGPVTVEAVVRLDDDSVFINVAAQISEFAGVGFVLGDNPPAFSVARPAGTISQVVSTVTLVEATTYHLAGVWEADGTLRIYVNGVDTTSVGDTHTIGLFDTDGLVLLGGSHLDAGFVGTLDEVAFYDHALSAARIAAHAAAVTLPWDEDTAEERVTRILDAVDWPVALRDIDTDADTVLQSADLDMSALEHLQKVAASEFGAIYVTADGTLRFESRLARVNQPTEAFFSDDAGSDLPITFSAAAISDEHIRNDVTVSRLDGAAQNAKDPASIATYQLSSYVLDGLYHADDTHSRDLANLLLSEYKTPVERVDQMTVNPYRDPATLWPAILALELTDRVELEETPVWVTPAVTRTLVVEGISHQFGPKQWEASFNLSPALAGDSCFLQLDTGPCGLDDARLFV